MSFDTRAKISRPTQIKAVGLLTDNNGGAIVLELEKSWLSNISSVQYEHYNLQTDLYLIHA